MRTARGAPTALSPPELKRPQALSFLSAPNLYSDRSLTPLDGGDSHSQANTSNHSRLFRKSTPVWVFCLPQPKNPPAPCTHQIPVRISSFTPFPLSYLRCPKDHLARRETTSQKIAPFHPYRPPPAPTRPLPTFALISENSPPPYKPPSSLSVPPSS